MSMDIKTLQIEVHKVAKLKGWWNPAGQNNIPEKLALIHSEISEALEEYRTGDSLAEIFYEAKRKPVGFTTELADVIIRVLDLAEYLEIDLEEAIKVKMEYNITRPYRHGGKRA